MNEAEKREEYIYAVRDGALEIGSGGSVGPISKCGCEIEDPVRRSDF